MGSGLSTAIRVLTAITLGGLLFSTGLRLSWVEVAHALRRNRLFWILPINFIVVPALGFALVQWFGLGTEIGAAMLLLAAAPFAPVVPTFTRLAKGNLALAGVLTGLFPFLSALLTPLVCDVTLRPLLGAGVLRFHVVSIFLMLSTTITLPLLLGMVVLHFFPARADRLAGLIRVLSEAVGAVGLAVIIVAEFHEILSIGWKPMLAMILLSELSFLAGYVLSGPSSAARLVVALGTANRNIALAMLIALQSFPGTPIVPGVAANGLLMILFGLAHVGAWRLFVADRAG